MPTDALRKQLRRDVEALAGVGITVQIEGEREGRLYRLPPSGFSPVEVDLSDEERAVLVGASGPSEETSPTRDPCVCPRQPHRRRIRGYPARRNEDEEGPRNLRRCRHQG